jgi:hypothetical protein
LPYLSRLAANGVPATSTRHPWPYAEKDLAVYRGPHPSAAHQYASFILEDIHDYVSMGYWVVLPYSSVRQFPQLKLAPAGVVPQQERRPRPIMDYSYNLVNQLSLPLANPQAMQFGGALQRFLQQLVYANPTYGPPLMAKIDLADGHYRVPLSPTAALQLAVVLPADASNDHLIGAPLSLPMGWGQSPPFFCAFTETSADLANHHTNQAMTWTPHPLELATQTLPFLFDAAYDPSATLPTGVPTTSMPLQYVDVYIDDFLVAAQPPAAPQLMRTVLHCINAVYQDPPTSRRRQVILASKLAKGDASWGTVKISLPGPSIRRL